MSGAAAWSGGSDESCFHDCHIKQMRMQVLKIIATIGAAILCVVAGPAHAQTKTLRVASLGGINEAVVTKYVASRFTADTGIKIEWVQGDAPTFVQKLIAGKGRPPMLDIVTLDDKTQLQAIEEGLVQKLDPKIVTNLQYLYKEARNPDGYGPATLFWGWGMIFNVEKFKEAGIPEPKSWADLWNPKLAGRVALADISGPGGVDFVLKAAELAGGDERNLAPGLQKIKDLKVKTFYTSSADLKVKLQSGEVWAAAWNNGRSWDLIGDGFPGKFFYPSDGGFFHTSTADVVAGSPNAKEAQLYINYILDPVSQTGRSYENPFGPVNSLVGEVMKHYPDAARKILLIDDIQKMKSADWKVIFDDYPSLVDAWDRIVKG
jgi:putative spermidine/putrescine transport system substrate-binding protein